jgi:L-aspartate oxidase
VLKVIGASVLDTATSEVGRVFAPFTVLATGGCGAVFLHTSNPPGADGSGYAMALRAGARIGNMEYIQFHPTVFRRENGDGFLISEAVRGEGGVLRNAAGERFMPAVHEQAELAPRDIVARAILTEMQRTGSDRVYIDVTHLPAGRIAARFPQILRYCLDHGVDMTKEPVPVSPAAHYMMGGVRTNTWGETTIPGLYACGETACTGVHGANRLASNSLLETVVFAKRVVRRTVESPGTAAESLPDVIDLAAAPSEAEAAADRASLQALMWDKVGIVRDGGGRRRPRRRLQRGAGLPVRTTADARTREPAARRPAHGRSRAAARGEPRRALPHRLPAPAR